MRISDWSSDVCSSDLRGIQVDVWGKFLRNDEPPCELLVVLFGALVSQQRERRISHHGPVHRLPVRRVAQTCGELRILEYVNGCLAETGERFSFLQAKDLESPSDRSEEHTSELQSLMRIS